MLSKKAIEEFQTIYRKVYGQDITMSEAEAKGMALLRLYKAVLKPTDLKDNMASKNETQDLKQ